MRGYSPAYHSEHLPFDARQHGRATRADQGALAPGRFTAGIPNTQSPACQSPPTLALQRSPRQHHRQLSAAPRHLLVPLAVRGRSPKMHPTVLPPAEGRPPSTSLPPAERPPPKGKLDRRTLMAANVCTTISGRLFVMDRKSKQRYLVDTGTDLYVFPRRLLRGAGSAQTTHYTQQMGPPSPRMD